MRRLLIVVISMLSFESHSQFKNIKLAEETEGYAPLNPSIAISHKEPKNIVVGMSLNRSFFTKDGGMTWSQSRLSPNGGGNPVLISDQKGHMYCFQRFDPEGKGNNNEAWLDHIICQESDDGGMKWDEEISFGSNPPKDQDRYWVTVHPKKSILYATWTQYDQYGIADPNCHSNILYSMSMNGGNKWTKSVQLNQNPGNCKDDDGTAVDSSPAVSITGKIYTAWVNNGTIFFDRSYDGGETWLTNDIAIQKQSGGWSLNIPGIGRSHSKPSLVVDVSPTRAMGTLYMVYANQKNGVSDTDVWFIRSVNHGDNWTIPLRLSKDESGAHQFSPAISVDPTTGFIYIVYYDRRASGNIQGDLQTDVYLSYSLDGGNVFHEKKISETAFNPTESKTLGEFIGIAAAGGIIAPVWTRSDNGKVSVWTTVIKGDELPRK